MAGKKAAKPKGRTQWPAAVVPLLVAGVAVVAYARPDLARALYDLALARARPAAAPSRAGTPAANKARSLRQAPACTDESIACPQWSRLGECENNPAFMTETCPLSCGKCDQPRQARPASSCVDEDENCEPWALRGQCVKNAEFMQAKCRKSCGVCGPYGPACERIGEAAVSPGVMNETFRRALTDFPQYSPQATHADPWVIRFDNFLSSEEADHIVSLCADSFQRSLAGDRVSSVRTSDQCWCNWGGCIRDPVIARIEERISTVTRVPTVNGEFMQIVRYGEGQFYREHHDSNSASWSPQGVRVYTFFMYLNDVPEGGETSFRKLNNLKVQPKKGSAILWPSVRDADPAEVEQGTYHEAMPVKRGVKYGANVWLHMHNFKSVSERHCLFTMKNTEE
jgi:hypothetical protein